MRAHVSGVVDSLVLRVMQQIFVASHRKGVEQTGGVQALGGSWRELAELAAGDPLAVYPDPTPPEGVVAGTCDCGLPTFRTDRGVRCLDSGCEHGHAVEA